MLKIKFVNNDIQSSNEKKSNTYKIAFKNKNQFESQNNDIAFKINDRVVHNDEKLTGKISFINGDIISVVWDDGTRERFLKHQSKQLSIHNSEEKTTESVKEMVKEVPETRKISTKQNNEIVPQLSELDKLYNQAFNNMDDEYEDIIDANPNKLKEQMLKRQVDMMEKKIENKKINNIKEQSVNELISLMKDKNMITDSTSEKQQRESIMKMTDSEFENFKQNVLNGKCENKEHELTEAEKMLQRIKFGGPIMGGFDEPSSIVSNQSETRNLSSEIQNRTFKTEASKNNMNENKLNLDGFKDLQGLTKPLQVTNEQRSPRQNIAEAISGLDWTTMTKMF